MDTIIIRPAVAQDADTIASIYNYYIENSSISFEEAAVSSPEIQQRIDKVIAAGFTWLVYESDKQILGYAYATKWNEREAYRFTAESTVYVAHDAASTGIGTSLYQALLEQLQHQSIRNVIAVIALPNEASEQLHNKFGFSKVGEFKQVGYKFERWINVAYWQLSLQDS